METLELWTYLLLWPTLAWALWSDKRKRNS